MNKSAIPMQTIRLANLRFLISENGGPQNLAKKLGLTNPSFVSHLAGPNPTRIITEKTARKIEADLGLLEGWMDIKGATQVIYKNHAPHIRAIDQLVLTNNPENVILEQHESVSDTRTTSSTLDLARLTEILEKVLQKSGNLSAKQLSKITTVLYSSSHSDTQLDAMLDSLIELMSL